jgi:hypothetical protein
MLRQNRKLKLAKKQSLQKRQYDSRDSSTLARRSDQNPWHEQSRQFELVVVPLIEPLVEASPRPRDMSLATFQNRHSPSIRPGCPESAPCDPKRAWVPMTD